MNKNSNTYQILYSAVMVILVGAALAFIYMALKPKQDENVANDKRKQILGAIHVAPQDDSQVEATFNKYITGSFLVDTCGNDLADTTVKAFDIDMKNNVKSEQRRLPVFKATLDDGSTKYIVPVYGAGLWGPIWGYVAVDDNGTGIYGAYFSHEGETPGLGAEIATPKFQQQFSGKQILKDGEFKSVGVLKQGQVPLHGEDYVNAISGGTITSQGVQKMLEDCMTPYAPFFKRLQGAKPAACTSECAPAV